MAASSSNQVQENLSERDPEIMCGKVPECFAPLTIIGGKGGRAFQFPKWKDNIPQHFNPVHKIDIFIGEPPSFLYSRHRAVNSSIQGIRVTLRNGEKKRFGSKTANIVSFEIHLGDSLRELKMLSNKEGTHIAQISLRTEQGQEFLAKGTNNISENNCKVDIGSGICLGIVGRSGKSLNKLGFIFLRSITATQLKNISYPKIKTNWIHLQREDLSKLPNEQPPETYIKIFKQCQEQHTWFLPEFVLRHFPPQVTTLNFFVFKNAAHISTPTYGIFDESTQLTVDLHNHERTIRGASYQTEKVYKSNNSVLLDVPSEVTAYLLKCRIIGLPFVGSLQLSLEQQNSIIFQVEGRVQSTFYSQVYYGIKPLQQQQ